MEKFQSNSYLNKQLFYLVNLPRLISVIFIIEIFIAIIFYTGGTFLDNSTHGYIFDKNFFTPLKSFYPLFFAMSKNCNFSKIKKN